MEAIRAVTDFDKLHAVLKQWAKGVPGIGTLHVYDTAAPYASFMAYDNELGRLTPVQLEDFLCINKKVFQGKLTPVQQLQQHKTFVVRYRRSCKSGTSTTTSKKGGCNRP